MSQFNNSFDVLPDFSTAIPEPQPEVPYTDNPAPPAVEDERTTLWRAIYGLGRNFDAFVHRQAEETKVIEALAQRLSALPVAQAAGFSTSSGSAPRVREPRVFDGQANQVDPFVREITNSLFLQRRAIVTDREKCLYFGFYLKDGSPSAWYTSVEKNQPTLLDDYSAFLKAFKKHFEDSDRYATALAKLRKLKQDPGSAANYASRFRELSWELDLTDQTSIQMFYDGLKDNVKDAITITTVNGAPSLFDDYVKMAISIDNKLHRREVERRTGPSKSVFNKTSSNSRSSFNHSSTPHVSTSTPSTSVPSAPSSSSNNDVVPMEIDATKHRGPLTDAERDYRRQNHLCYYCGKGKHSVQECPNMSDAAKKKFKGKGKASPSGKA